MANKLMPFQLLELNVISAQDLEKVTGGTMKTYAVAWVHPDRKLSTRVDAAGGCNPTWNDKFVFRVDDHFLYADTSAIMIDIYALHWLRDVHVGTVRIIVGNLIPPATDRCGSHHHHHVGMRFVALQVRRRSSGRPQGILNIGVAILDSSMRSMPLYTQLSTSAVGYREVMDGDHHNRHHGAVEKDPHPRGREEDGRESTSQYIVPWIPKPELRRVKSDSSSLVVPAEAVAQKKTNKEKARSEASSTTSDSNRRHGRVSSVVNVNGSALFGSLAKVKYGSEVDAPAPAPAVGGSGGGGGGHHHHQHNQHNFLDVGPSASEVAAMTARQRGFREDEGSEVVGDWGWESSMEGLQSKLERWRAEIPKGGGRKNYDNDFEDKDDTSSSMLSWVNKKKKHRRRSNAGAAEDGAFSCFSNICGLQCAVVCGGGSAGRRKDARRRRRNNKRSPSTYSMMSSVV